MIRKISILITVLTLAANLHANTESRSLTSYLTDFAELTPYRLYFKSTETDHKTVEAIFPRDGNLEALIRICTNAGFKVSFFENRVFILMNTGLNTELSISSAETPVNETRSGEQSITTARSEYRIYEVGSNVLTDTTAVVLSGTITDFSTRHPVGGATLQLAGKLNGTTTGSDGTYNLTLKPGLYELLISGLGIHDTRRQVRIYSSGKLNIETDEQVFEIEELTILSSRTNKVRDTGMGVERFKMSEIKNIPTAFGETDVLKAVLTLPGVTSGGELSGGFNVRGGATDQNLILLNHNTIYNPTHLFGLVSTFNPDLTDNMELYMSNIPAKYGGRTASVLEVNSNNSPKSKLRGSVSVGMLSSRIALEGPLGKSTSFAIGGRASFTDWLMNILPANSGYNEGKANFYDINAVVHHQFDNKTQLQLHAYHSQDQFNFEPTETFSYENLHFSGSLRRQHNYRLFGTYTTGYDRYSNSIGNEANPATSYELSTGIQQVFARANYDFYVSPQHTLTMGIHLLYYDLEPGKFSPQGAQSLVTPASIQPDRAIENSIYLSDEWNINDQLAISAGMRYTLYNLIGPRQYYTYLPEVMPSVATINDTINSTKLFQKNYNGPEIRFSARYILRDDLSVKAGVNSMRQYIHKISNATVLSPTDTWKLSDHHIRPQSGIQWGAGIYKNFMRNQVISAVEVYYKSTNNYLDYRNGAKLVMNPHLETEVTETEGKAYGIEFSVKKPLGKLNGWLSYTWSRSFLRQTDLLLSNPVNDGNWFASDIDKPHDLKLIANYRFTRRYSLSYNALYSTGRPITLPVAKYRFAGGEYVYYSDRNQYRIPDFMRMDIAFNIEPSHQLTRLTHSMLSIGVYNLTGRKNVYSIFFKPVHGALKGYQLSIFGAPIPYLSYTIKF